MIVLSCFDGISAGQEALKRCGIKVDKYYSSEIDKTAIDITNYNWPNTIQLGDINNWKNWDIEKPNLIMGGSPCQGFSVAGKLLNFDDPRSKLFFKFAEIIDYYKPKYFLLENVRMKQEWQDIISKYLNVKPILIDSALVSAQRRKRFYWFNWKVEQPKNKGILLRDIIHENTFTEQQKSYCIDANYHKGIDGYFERKKRQLVFEELNEYIVPFDDTLKILNKEVERGKVGYFRKDSQANRVYYIHNKAVTLCGSAGGGAGKMGQYLFGCITPNRINKRQNGQRFNDGNKFYTLTAQDKHGILIEGYIRKLTPLECERLQTLKDDYTKYGNDYIISNTQRYKTLGNSWTVDVISHILKGMNV